MLDLMFRCFVLLVVVSSKVLIDIVYINILQTFLSRTSGDSFWEGLKATSPVSSPCRTRYPVRRGFAALLGADYMRPVQIQTANNMKIF